MLRYGATDRSEWSVHATDCRSQPIRDGSRKAPPRVRGALRRRHRRPALADLARYRPFRDSRSLPSNAFTTSPAAAKKPHAGDPGSGSPPAAHRSRYRHCRPRHSLAADPARHARSSAGGTASIRMASIRNGPDAGEKWLYSVIQATFVGLRGRLRCHMQILWQYNDTDQMIRVSEARQEPGKAGICERRRPAGPSFTAHDQNPGQMGPRLRRTHHSPMHDERSEPTTTRHSALRCSARRRALTPWI